MGNNILINFLGRKSGTAVYSYEMTKGLIENGASVYAIISQQNFMLEEWEKLNLKGLYIYPTYHSVWTFIIATLRFLMSGRRKIMNETKDWNIDIVYVPAFHLWSEWINRLFPKAYKIITTHDALPHSGNIFRNKMVWYYNAISLKKANDVVILSEKFRSVIKKRTGLSDDNIHVIPHGCFDFYEKAYNSKKYFYGDHKVNYLFFGRIEPYKGLDVLAKAYKMLIDEGYDVSLTIAGNGDFSAYKKDFDSLKNVNIENRWIKDEEVLGFFQENNIVTVLPYLNATQSGVVNIAMKQKSLVIVSNAGGLVEQVKHMESGLVVNKNNVIALYEAMKYALCHKSDIEKIKANAYIKMKDISWSKLSKRIIDIIANR